MPPGHLTPLLQEWVAHLGTWVPFGQVPRLLALFAGITLSAETARRQTEAAGSLLLAAETAAAPALAPPADPGPDTDARLQVSTDGAMVRLQSGEWVEVKTCAIGQVVRGQDAAGQPQAQAADLSYFARHASAAEFTRLSIVELHRRGVRRAAAVAGICDGAEWNQRFLDYHRPDAPRILDHPHAVEHVAAVGAAVWGAESPQTQEWVAACARQLKQEGPASLLETIARWRAADPTNEALAVHGEYLAKRARQMDYPAFRAAGWPLGSGIVESGNKLVVEARLKGAGMGWGVAQLNPMLALRSAVCSRRGEAAWATITAEQRRQRGERGRRTGRPPALASEEGPPAPPAPRSVNPVVVAEVESILSRVQEEVAAERAGRASVDGKPGPHHPWRRRPLSRPSPPCPTPPNAAKL